MSQKTNNELEYICQKVVYCRAENYSTESFFAFITDNLENVIYVSHLADINLQLIQLLPGLELMHSQQKFIIFLDKGTAKNFSDKAYFDFILMLAQNEQKVIVRRTIKGLEASARKGMKFGRPGLPKEKVQEIQALYYNELRTYREISEICSVSVGTVHKYVNSLELKGYPSNVGSSVEKNEFRGSNICES